MRPRIIIVEGPDNTGKSTLAKKIAKYFNMPYWHMTSGPGLQEKDAMALYQRDALKNAYHAVETANGIVFDRHWVSDHVYGNVLRDGPALPEGEMLTLSIEHDFLYIFCDRQDHIIHDAHEANQDPDHPYDREQYAQIVEEYRQMRFFLEESLPKDRVLFYDMDLMGTDNMTDAFLRGMNSL